MNTTRKRAAKTAPTMSAPVLRRRKPYTCRALVAGQPCAAILAESDGNECAAHAGQLVPGLKPLARVVRADDDPVVPKPHWPFWPGADAPSSCGHCGGSRVVACISGPAEPCGACEEREAANAEAERQAEADDGFDEDALWEQRQHQLTVAREDAYNVPEDQR